MVKRVMLARQRRALRFCLLACGGLFAGGQAAAQTQQFSANIVVQADTAAMPAGRLRVLDGKVRIETPEFAHGFFLVDTAKPSASFVRPGARIYMDARQSSRLTRLFVPVDSDAPCTHWQAMARLAGVVEQRDWACERTGEETIDGRMADVFRAVSGSGQHYSGWIDRERKFPLRIRLDDGTILALAQVKDEPQPAASFEIPANSRKFSPEALIERIKQSDVWVAGTGDSDSSRP